MILIYGDLVRSIWLFIDCTSVIIRGRERMGRTFCQSSGFLIHYGKLTSGMYIITLSLRVFLMKSRLRRPRNRHTQCASSLPPFNASHFRRSVSISPLRISRCPAHPRYDVWLGFYQLARGLLGPRRVLHPSHSTILVPFGLGMDTKIYHRRDHHGPCRCHIHICRFRIPQVRQGESECQEFTERGYHDNNGAARKRVRWSTDIRHVRSGRLGRGSTQSFIHCSRHRRSTPP